MTAAFVIACLTPLLSAVPVAPAPEPGWRPARLAEEGLTARGPVVDGDTFDLEVDHTWAGDELHGRVRVRLHDVDAPEIRDPLGPLATLRAAAWFAACERAAGGERWYLVLRAKDRGSFGRPLAQVVCRADGSEVSAVVLGDPDP